MTIALDDLATPATPSGARKAKAEGSLIVGGRYKVGGKSYQRATNFTKILSDSYNLELWKQRKVARGVAAHRDLQALILAVPVEDEDPALKKQLDGYVEQAKNLARADSGANMGTALHALCERADLGETLTLPDDLQADVAAYRAMLGRHGLTVGAKWIERVIVIESLGVAGTFDRIVGQRGRNYVGDLKTGRMGYWLEIAIQLALYAHADYVFDPLDGSKVDMPNVDQEKAYVFHLSPGSAQCDLYEVDIATGWDAVQLSRQVRAMRKNDQSLGKKVEEPPAPYKVPAVGEAQPAPISPATPWEPPDEGDLIENADRAGLNARVTDDIKPWIKRWGTEAQQAGRSWHMSEKATVRRFEIARAAIACARLVTDDTEFGTEQVRDLLAAAMGSDAPLMPANTLGACFGSLTIAEATHLVELAATFGEYPVKVERGRIVPAA